MGYHGGMPKGGPRKPTDVHVILPDDLYQQLQQCSWSEDRSMSGIIRQALKEYLEGKGQR